MNNGLSPFKVAKILAKKQSEQIEFRDCSDLASDTENFLVIGVLGEDGTGKSTLLNQFGEYFCQEKSCQPFQTHQSPPVKALTNGAVVAAIASNYSGLILIDSQPCCSSSMVSSMILKDAYYPQEFSSHEHWNFIQSTQIAMWMMCSCHFTFVVQNDAEPSLGFLKWIRQVAKMNRQLSHNPFGGSKHYLSQTIFYLNEEIYDLQSDINMESIINWNLILNRLFRDTFGSHHCISPFLDLPQDIIEHYNTSTRPVSDTCSTPQFYDQNLEIEAKTHVSFWIDHNDPIHRQEFFERVLSLPRPYLSSKITMKEWFYKSKLAWELINSSQIISNFKNNY